MMRDKNSRNASEHSAALAAANAAILRNAARALIRNCDTLQLMRAGSSGGDSSSGAGAAGDAAAAIGSAQDGSGARISALLCLDEMQVKRQRVLSRFATAAPAAQFFDQPKLTAPNFDSSKFLWLKIWQHQIFVAARIWAAPNFGAAQDWASTKFSECAKLCGSQILPAIIC
jgi:hypothetical protein